jgi:prophage antirepressor-like protein
MAEDGQSLIIIEQFENHEIRKIWFKDEWWYSLVDVISVFSGTDRARKYWSDLKKKIQVEEGYSELSEKIGQLKRYSDP